MNTLALSATSHAYARPLVVRFGALGDTAILTALIRALHARFDAPVDVACGGWVQPLLESQPGVGKLYPLFTRRLPYVINPQQWLFVERLRARGPGPVWICQTDDISHSLVRRAGIESRWCVTQRDFPTQPNEHAVDRLLRMAHAIPPMLAQMPDRPPSRTAPKLVLPPGARDDARAWLARRGLEGRPLILVQAGNKRTMRIGTRKRARNKKYWPEERWAAVLDGLHSRLPDAAILLLGVRLESLLNRDILQHARTRGAVDVAGEVPVTRLIALCAQARGMVSVDTGPAHVAAAVGCPLVVMFGSQDPTFYAPRSESSVVEVISGSRTSEHPLLDITPQAVLDAWERLNAQTNESPPRAQ